MFEKVSLSPLLCLECKPKINLEILVSLLDVFSTFTSPRQTIFNTQKKTAQLSNLFWLLMPPRLFRQLFERNLSLKLAQNDKFNLQ